MCRMHVRMPRVVACGLVCGLAACVWGGLVMGLVMLLVFTTVNSVREPRREREGSEGLGAVARSLRSAPALNTPAGRTLFDSRTLRVFFCVAACGCADCLYSVVGATTMRQLHVAASRRPSLHLARRSVTACACADCRHGRAPPLHPDVARSHSEEVCPIM